MNHSDDTRTWAASPQVLRIGSAEDNDVVLDDSHVSKYHVELRRLASGWNVRDLGSSNGTFLNGVQVLSAVAQLGDTLRIGHTEMALDADGPRLLSSHTPRDAAVPNLPDDLPAADTAAPNRASATTDSSPVAVERRASAANPEQTVSPDGQWRWDGAQWVPNQTTSGQPNAPQGTSPSMETDDTQANNIQTIMKGIVVAVAVVALAMVGWQVALDWNAQRNWDSLNEREKQVMCLHTGLRGATATADEANRNGGNHLSSSEEKAVADLLVKECG